jgi:hypothetical protein
METEVMQTEGVTTKKIVKVYQDSDPSSPREWDNLGTIAYKHSRYNLGEEKIDDPIEWLEDMLGIPNSYKYTNERLSELEYIFYKKFIAEPVYIYDHGSVAISTSPFGCRWDSGKVGYIYISKADALKEYGGKIVTKKLRERIEGYLSAEIETYSQYLSGDVYGFRVFEIEADEDGDFDEDNEDNEIDSCWGFYGSDFLNNGMADHIDKELHEQLKGIEINY